MKIYVKTNKISVLKNPLVREKFVKILSKRNKLYKKAMKRSSIKKSEVSEATKCHNNFIITTM